MDITINEHQKVYENEPAHETKTPRLNWAKPRIRSIYEEHLKSRIKNIYQNEVKQVDQTNYKTNISTLITKLHDATKEGYEQTLATLKNEQHEIRISVNQITNKRRRREQQTKSIHEIHNLKNKYNQLYG